MYKRQDLAWERVKRVEDIVNVGDKVTVFVGDVNAEQERVSLILKDVDKEPWKVHSDNIKSGDIIEGKVVKFMSFGAFIAVSYTHLDVYKRQYQELVHYYLLLQIVYIAYQPQLLIEIH